MASQFSFEAIGTHWHIVIHDKLDAQNEQQLVRIIKERIEIFDKAYSRFRSDSLVIEMSKKAGVYTLPGDAKKMIDLYADLYTLTKGHITPLIGQVLVDAGYDAVYSLTQHKPLEQPPAWNDVLEYVFPTLTIKKPVLLDFGAAGKGYLIDLIGELLIKNSVTTFYIDAGGDILHRDSGSAALEIGLENPKNFDEVIGIIKLKNKSLCGSAGNRRKWGNFHHIMNPYTLSSPREIIATWVVADSTLLADGLASCLFFVAPGTLTSSYAFEYLVVYSDMSIEKSGGFPGELFAL